MFNPFKEPKPKKPILEMTEAELQEFRETQKAYERGKDKFFCRIAVLALAIAIFRIFYTGSLIELAKAIWQRL